MSSQQPIIDRRRWADATPPWHRRLRYRVWLVWFRVKWWRGYKCWIGHHNWREIEDENSDGELYTLGRECLRCNRKEWTDTDG